MGGTTHLDGGPGTMSGEDCYAYTSRKATARAEVAWVQPALCGMEEPAQVSGVENWWDPGAKHNLIICAPRPSRRWAEQSCLGTVKLWEPNH